MTKFLEWFFGERAVKTSQDGVYLQPVGSVNTNPWASAVKDETRSERGNCIRAAIMLDGDSMVGGKNGDMASKLRGQGMDAVNDLEARIETLEKRLEAADLTIGTLQADRLKAQATIGHYRTMLEEAEKKAHDWEEICRHLKAEKPDQRRAALAGKE